MKNSLLDGVVSAEEARKIIGAKKNSPTREDFKWFRDNNKAFVNFLKKMEYSSQTLKGLG